MKGNGRECNVRTKVRAAIKRPDRCAFSYLSFSGRKAGALGLLCCASAKETGTVALAAVLPFLISQRKASVFSLAKESFAHRKRVFTTLQLKPTT